MTAARPGDFARAPVAVGSARELVAVFGEEASRFGDFAEVARDPPERPAFEEDV